MVVAVNVTFCPATEGFGAPTTVVANIEVVVIVTHQLPMDPESPLASSTTQRLHVPFTTPPWKVDSVAVLGTGAGAGNASGPSLSSSVGRKVPLVSGPGTAPAAASSKVTLTPLTGLWPPTSLISTTFLAPGPDIITSRSKGAACDSPLTVAVTLTRDPASPLTVMLEAYGLTVLGSVPRVRRGCRRYAR